MKKFAMVMVVVLVMVLIGISTGNATIIWQLGNVDGSVVPASIGAGEFKQGSGNTSNYIVDMNSYKIGDVPGYLYDSGLNDPNGNVWATNKLTINFTLSNTLTNGVLEYGRYGSEVALISLDGSPVNSIGGFNFTGIPFVGEGEGQWTKQGPYNPGNFFSPLPWETISAGDHFLTIEYLGLSNPAMIALNTLNIDLPSNFPLNGNYIDYVSLSGHQAPEPISMALFSFGLISLVGIKRRSIKGMLKR